MKKIKKLSLAIFLASLFSINVFLILPLPAQAACLNPSWTQNSCPSGKIPGELDDCSGIRLPWKNGTPNDTCCCARNFNSPAQTTNTPAPAVDKNSIQFTPQVAIPGSLFQGTVTVTGDMLGKYVVAIYNYGLAIVGILGAIMLMAGGLIWLTSGGNTTKIGQAKELMFGSIIGMVILVSAWMILNTVNPALTTFQPINPIVIKAIDYCCDQTKGNVLMIDGKCSSGQICSSGATCTNGGKNNFTCVDANSNICCQYSFVNPSNNKAGHACVSTTDSKCQVLQNTSSMTFDNNGSAVKVFKNLYCGSVTILDGNTDCNEITTGGDCTNVADGKVCQNMPSGLNNGLCYNNTCWYGPAKTGEACGTGQGFVCMKGNTNGNCPSGYSESHASRYCSVSGDTCCKKN